MTRKRYINLLRATLLEMSKHSDVKFNLKNFEQGFGKLHRCYAKEFGNYSYSELWKTFEPIAHKYGIGGY